MDSFYVNLFSNVSLQGDSKSNTGASFNTELAGPISLDGDYEVGLAEISYPCSWYNLPTPAAVRLINVGGPASDIQTQVLPAGNYKTKEILVQECNKLIQMFTFDDLIPSASLPHLFIQGHTQLVFMASSNPRSKYYIVFSDRLRGLLGSTISICEHASQLLYGEGREDLSDRYSKMRHTVIKEAMDKTENDLPYNGDISGGLQTLLVYSDITRHVLVGDKLAPLLRAVHVTHNTRFGAQVNFHYDRPEYKPLLQREIRHIRIGIYDDSGQLVPFNFGRVRCTLIFRRVPAS